MSYFRTIRNVAEVCESESGAVYISVFCLWRNTKGKEQVPVCSVNQDKRFCLASATPASAAQRPLRLFKGKFLLLSVMKASTLPVMAFSRYLAQTA